MVFVATRAARLDENDGQARLGQARVQPLRHRPGLRADAAEGQLGRGQRSGERSRLAFGLELADDRARAIHDADAARLERNVDASVAGHLGASRSAGPHARLEEQPVTAAPAAARPDYGV
jgi:hypothetical protein